MNISRWEEDTGTGPGTMISVSKSEAVQIIESLAHQFSVNGNNEGRKEFFTKTGEYFSISVVPDSPPMVGFKSDTIIADERNAGNPGCNHCLRYRDCKKD